MTRIASILLGLIAFLGLCGSALAQGTPMTKAQLYTLSNTTYCSTSGCITPTTMKTLTNDLIASYLDTGTLGLGFDTSFCSAQGSVLYRNATVWTCLAPGTAGRYLQTGGSAANPSWAAGTGGPVIRAIDPTVNDDSGAGYAVGSTWLNNTLNAAGTTHGGRFWEAYTVGVGTAKWYSGVLFDSSGNVGGGLSALVGLTTGTENLGFGRRALVTATTAAKNVALGIDTLANCTICTNNIAIGENALQTAVDDNGHVAIGKNSLLLMSGVPVAGLGPWNTAIGDSSMQNMTTGGSNACIGRGCMVAETIGAFNAGVGHGSLFTGTNNSSVVGIGNLAGGAFLACQSGGASRTVIPIGQPNAGLVLCPWSGESYSVAIGENAGGGVANNDANSIGKSNRIAIGAYARAGTNANNMALGNGMTDVVTAGRMWTGITVSNNATAAGTTLTTTDLISGILYRTGTAAAFSDTTPTAAAMVAAAAGNSHNAGVGQIITVINGTSFTQSLGLGAGVTTSGSAPFTVLGLTNAQFLLRITNAAPGSETMTMDLLTSSVAKPDDIQVFSTPGAATWTKPSGAKAIKVILVGAGGAGGSGARRATASSGGAGGGGGGVTMATFKASDLGNTETVSVGTLALGGASIVVDATSGTTGGTGGTAIFGSAATQVRAFGGAGGQGGQNGGASTGGTPGFGQLNGTTGGAGVSAAAGAAGVSQSAANVIGPTGGGAGAGQDGGGLASNVGGAGGSMSVYRNSGAAGGTNAPGVGGAGSTTATLANGNLGGGAGGGGANVAGTAAAGGVGGDFGGGGGGGATSNNGLASGAGGNGGGSVVVVISSF